MLYLHDALTLDAPRKTRDGYMVAHALSARTGVYDYLGAEVDPEGKRFKADQIVKVYRPAEEVFAEDSVASFFAKPVTNDHPTVPVTADNWKQHSRGAVMGAKRRVIGKDEYLAFDLTLMDAEAIKAVESGKRELSNGYSCELAFDAGTTADGQAYDAIQKNIRGNHVAIVDRGRAGSECRISDGGNRFADCASNPQAIEDLQRTNAMNFIMLDELKVDLADADAVKAAVAKLQDKAATSVAALATAETAHAAAITAKDAELATKDATIITLEKQVADAKVTPAMLRDAGKAYALVCDKAKFLKVDIADDADEPAIMKACVDAAMGDKAMDWGANEIAASFAMLTKDFKASEDQHLPIHAPLTNDDGKAVTDARAKMIADMLAGGTAAADA